MDGPAAIRFPASTANRQTVEDAVKPTALLLGIKQKRSLLQRIHELDYAYKAYELFFEFQTRPTTFIEPPRPVTREPRSWIDSLSASRSGPCKYRFKEWDGLLGTKIRKMRIV